MTSTSRPVKVLEVSSVSMRILLLPETCARVIASGTDANVFVH